jgi:hypothetical protein
MYYVVFCKITIIIIVIRLNKYINYLYFYYSKNTVQFILADLKIDHGWSVKEGKKMFEDSKISAYRKISGTQLV